MLYVLLAIRISENMFSFIG